MGFYQLSAKWRSRMLVLALGAFSFILSAYTVPTPRLKPETQGPVYLAENDYRTLRLFFKAMDSRQWTTAETYRKQLKDPVAKNIADWAFYRSVPSRAGFREIGTFLDRNIDWPRSTTLQRNAEKTIKNSDDAGSIKQFFTKREPLTGNGKIQLARVLLGEGDDDGAKKLIRSAWVDHNWPTKDERNLLSTYGKHLKAQDHIDKVDRQLFENKISVTKRLFSLLPSRERKMAETRAALLLSQSEGPRLFNSLSNAERKDSGVLHAATRYFRRKDQETTALSYAALGPVTPESIRNPERWWLERRLLMRWALKNARYQDAYNMAAFSGLREGGSFSDAEFTAGWIALRFLNQPERARQHFAFLDANVTAPISKARAQYWLGRAWEAEGNLDAANRYYAVSAAWPFTYYGQLAAEKLEGILPFDKFPSPVTPTADELAVFNGRPLTYALKVMQELDRDREFIEFARALDDQIQSPGELVAYHKLMQEEDKIFLSVRAAKVARKQGAEVPEVSYPIYPVPQQAANFTEKALVLGLSRQESEFNPRAYSSAKAMGMMQMINATAQRTARKIGVRYSRSRLLDDPAYNYVLGAAHLSHLIEDNEGSYVLTLVAYNAGPRRVTRFIREYGDPRNPDVDPIDWVELVPFSETRNYIMRVLENTQIYRAQLTDEPIAGKLSADLTRGGSTILALEQTPSTPVLARLEAMTRKSATYELPKKKPYAVLADVQTTLPPLPGVKLVKDEQKALQEEVKTPTLSPNKEKSDAAKSLKKAVEQAPKPSLPKKEIDEKEIDEKTIPDKTVSPQDQSKATDLDEIGQIIEDTAQQETAPKTTQKPNRPAPISIVVPEPASSEAEDLNAQQLKQSAPTTDMLEDDMPAIASQETSVQTPPKRLCPEITAKLDQLGSATDLNTVLMREMLEKDLQSCTQE